MASLVALVAASAFSAILLPVGSASALPPILPDKVTISDPEPGGDGDGFAEPTESFQITAGLKNNHGSTITGLNGTSVSLSPFLTIDQAPSPYPALPNPGTATNTNPFRATAASATPCEGDLSFRVDSTSDQTPPVSSYFAVPVGNQSRGDTTATLAIPDNNVNGASSTMTLPAGAGQVSDVDLTFYIGHTNNANLNVYLIHGATTLPLLTHVNGNGDGMLVTLDDQALTAIELASVPAPGFNLSGTFRPEGVSLDGTFGGQDMSGAWTLKVVDDAAGDTGTLYFWTIAATNPCNRSPLASFIAAPGSPSRGQQATFASTSVDFDGSVASLAWDLDNDGAYDDGTGLTATRTFNDAGSFPIGLQATDNKGGSDTTRQDIVVPASVLSASRTSIPKQRLGKALREGLRVVVQLGADASIDASASVASAAAKNLGLTSRDVTIARGSKAGKAGSNTVVLKFTKKAKKKLKHARKVKLKLAVSAKDVGGATAAVSRSVTLKRRG